MTAIGSRCWVGILAGLVTFGLAAGAAQTLDDFANACSPLVSLSTMIPPPGDKGDVVRKLQTVAVGIAQGNADVIVSAYAEAARIENFPRLLGDRAGALVSGRDLVMSKDELRRIYQAYFQNFPQSAIVFTRVSVSVQEGYATASAHARFVLLPGSGHDTHNTTVTWKLAREQDGWRIIEERYQE